MDKEIRTLTEAEVRVEPDSRKVEGYGIVFNKESHDLGGFREVIIPEAMDGVIERSDILALLNHDISKGVLARSTDGKGSMTITIDDRGAKYSFKAPRYSAGEELMEGIERGDIRNSSFAFTVAPNGEAWEKQPDGTYLRTITQFDQLYDMSPCYKAAYQDTTVAKRSMEQAEKVNEEVEGEDTKPDVEEPTTEPIAKADPRSDYHRHLRQKNEYEKLKLKR